MSIQAITGLWDDWSQEAAIARWTLTLTSRDGAYLLSGLVAVIGFAGQAVWSITAFSLHQYRARPEAMDGLQHQLQVLLRNAPSAPTACWKLMCMMRTWSGNATNARTRIFLTLLWPLTICIAFSVAAVFVSRVVQTADKVTDIRIKGTGICGVPSVSPSSPLSHPFALAAKTAADTRNAAAQIDRCQASGSLQPGCVDLGIKTRTVRCQFDDEARCLSEPQQYDSGYMDSNKVLKINAAPHERIEVRMRTTCSALNVSDVVRTIPDTSVTGNASSIIGINLGSVAGSVSPTFVYPERYIRSLLTYTISSVYYYDGGRNSSAWVPIDAIHVPFADTIVHLITPNAVSYLRSVTDATFLASGSKTTTSLNGTTLYQPDDGIGVVVCTEQFEYRNPVTNDTTNLLGYVQAQERLDQIGLTDVQQATAWRAHLAMWPARNYNTVSGQGPNALQANKLLLGLVSQGLPPNQTAIETSRWFSQGLQNFHSRIQDFPSNSWYSSDSDALTGLTVMPAASYSGDFRATLADQCSTTVGQSQGQYSNFAFWGVLIVVIVSGVLLVLSWVLPFIVNAWPNRRAARSAVEEEGRRRQRPARADGAKRHKLRAYISDGLFSLARMAVQGASGKAWRDCKTDMPYRYEHEEGLSLIQPAVESEDSIDYVQPRELLPLNVDQDSGYDEVAPDHRRSQDGVR